LTMFGEEQIVERFHVRTDCRPLRGLGWCGIPYQPGAYAPG
jgi:hypothetical protein